MKAVYQNPPLSLLYLSFPFTAWQDLVLSSRIFLQHLSCLNLVIPPRWDEWPQTAEPSACPRCTLQVTASFPSQLLDYFSQPSGLCNVLRQPDPPHPFQKAQAEHQTSVSALWKVGKMYLPPRVRRTQMPFTRLALGQKSQRTSIWLLLQQWPQKGLVVVVIVVVVFKAGSYSDQESNIYAKMHSNSMLLNKLPSM